MRCWLLHGASWALPAIDAYLARANRGPQQGALQLLRGHLLVSEKKDLPGAAKALHIAASRPADLAVARIVGVDTVERASIVAMRDGLATVRIGSAQLVASAPATLNGEVYVCIHAGDVILDRGAPLSRNSARNRLTGRVMALVREGSMVRVSLDCGFPLKALVTNQACQELALREGEHVIALLKAPAIHLVPRD